MSAVALSAEGLPTILAALFCALMLGFRLCAIVLLLCVRREGRRPFLLYLFYFFVCGFER